MRYGMITIGLAAAVALGVIGFPAPAAAGGGYGHVGFSGHHGGHGGHGGFGHRSYGRAGFHGGHRSGFRRGRGGHGGHHTGHVLLGVGAGLLLYNAIDRSRDRHYGYAPGGHVVRPATPPRYAPRPVRADAAAGAETAANCLQTREYTTTITIGDEDVEAYGTACLQPDGAWLMGAPQRVPEFD